MTQKKNIYLREVTRVWILTRNAAKTNFIDLVLTAAYLINLMSSKGIYMKSPIDFLKCQFPGVNNFGSLLLKIFWCVVFFFFFHIFSQERSKLDSRALECTFLGYFPKQKGISVSILQQKKKKIVTMDVNILKISQAPRTDLQGENIGVEDLPHSLSQPSSFMYPAINDLFLFKFDKPKHPKRS